MIYGTEKINAFAESQQTDVSIHEKEKGEIPTAGQPVMQRGCVCVKNETYHSTITSFITAAKS